MCLCSHQFFHGRQVYSPHHEARGKRISQVMKRAIEAAGSPHRCTKGHRDIPVGLVLTGAKRRCGRNGVNPTGLQRVCQYRGHGHAARFPSLHKRLKTRGAFPSDESIVKLWYWALPNVAKKWTRSIRDWKTTLNQCVILFGDRVPV